MAPSIDKKEMRVYIQEPWYLLVIVIPTSLS